MFVSSDSEFAALLQNTPHCQQEPGRYAQSHPFALHNCSVYIAVLSNLAKSGTAAAAEAWRSTRLEMPGKAGPPPCSLLGPSPTARNARNPDNSSGRRRSTLLGTAENADEKAALLNTASTSILARDPPIIAPPSLYVRTSLRVKSPSERQTVQSSPRA